MTELNKYLDPVEAVGYYFERAADLNDVPEPTRAVLRMPMAELRVEVPVRRDDGQLDVYLGYRVQHNSARGPFNVTSATTRLPTSTRSGRSRR